METSDPILQLLSGFGMSGITALIAYAWMKKDKQYTDLAEKITTVLENHATVSAELKESIKANTKATNKLETTITNQLFDVLRNQRINNANTDPH